MSLALAQSRLYGRVDLYDNASTPTIDSVRTPFRHTTLSRLVRVTLSIMSYKSMMPSHFSASSLAHMQTSWDIF